MIQESRLHHTVPRFYLKGFADQERLTTVALPGARRFTQNVSQATAVNYFYSMPGNPEGADAYERELSRKENDAARVLRMVLDHGVWPLDVADRAVFGTFLALQLLRGPDQRRQVKEIASAVAQFIGGIAGVDAPTPEEMSEEWSADSLSTARHINQIQYLLPEVVRALCDRPWVLVRFVKRSLITPDTPLSPLPRPDSANEARIGLATAWGMTFPLDRRTGLVLAPPSSVRSSLSVDDVRHGRSDFYREGSTRNEQLFNLSTSINARRWIFHHPDDDRFVPPKLPHPSDGSMSAGAILDEFLSDPVVESDS
jgi:hypothetical protein